MLSQQMLRELLAKLGAWYEEYIVRIDKVLQAERLDSSRICLRCGVVVSASQQMIMHGQ